MQSELIQEVIYASDENKLGYMDIFRSNILSQQLF